MTMYMLKSDTQYVTVTGDVSSRQCDAMRITERQAALLRTADLPWSLRLVKLRMKDTPVVDLPPVQAPF